MDKKVPYDVKQDFEFAKSHGPMGLVFWNNPCEEDTAEGLGTFPSFDWMPSQARAYDLPMHINANGGSALWMANKFREQTMMKMPQFCGNYTYIGSWNGSSGVMSWSATTGEDTELGMIQATVRKYSPYSNTIGFFEPHGETPIGPQGLFLDYGPVADASYREYLKTRYTSLADLSRRWYGDTAALKAWSDVRVQEVASFAGWGPEAIDLRTTWRVKYLVAPDGHTFTPDEITRRNRSPIPTEPILPEWSQPGFDDSAWASLLAPGNDRMMFTPRQPAVFRGKFDVPSEWLKKNSKAYLYVWDLNESWDDTIPLSINGKAVPPMKLVALHIGARWT